MPRWSWVLILISSLAAGPAWAERPAVICPPAGASAPLVQGGGTTRLAEPLDLTQAWSLPGLSPEERAGLNSAPAGLIKIGLHRPLPAGPAPWRLVGASAQGQVWRLALRSPGAAMLRVRLGWFDPGRVQVLVAGPEGLAEGPLRPLQPARPFWAPPVAGEACLIEARLADPADLPLVDLVSHVFRPAGPEPLAPPQTGCEPDLACGEPAYQELGQGVAHLRFEMGDGTYICSGALLNDQDEATELRWFLTARHCQITFETAQTAYLYFRYQSPRCRFPFKPELGPRTDGAFLAAVGQASDFQLLLLQGAVPEGSTLLGWTTAWIEPGQAAVTIHHPRGLPKKISFGAVVPTVATQLAGVAVTDLDHLTVVWSEGVTEGGSSGGPLLVDGLVAGQLHGGASSCEALREPDYYGRFSFSWQAGLSRYLGGLHAPQAWPFLLTDRMTPAVDPAALHFAWATARYYSFSLAAPRRVKLSLVAPGFASALAVLNAQGQLLATATAETFAAEMTLDLAAGTYLVEAADLNGQAEEFRLEGGPAD